MVAQREDLEQAADALVKRGSDGSEIAVYFVSNKVCGLYIWRAYFNDCGSLLGAPGDFDLDDIETENP